MVGPLTSKFDGVGDYAENPNTLTGVANGKTFTFSTWFYKTSTATMTLYYGSQNDFRWYVFDSNDSIRFEVSDTDGVSALIATLGGGAAPVNTLTHFCGSIDMTDQSACWWYLNGVTKNFSPSTFNDVVLRFNTRAENYFARRDFAAGFFAGEIAQLAIWFNTFIPESEYEKLITPDAVNSVDYGADGSETMGVAADVFFNRETGSSNPDDLAINKGTGGPFTLAGGGLDEGTVTIPPYVSGAGGGALMGL